MEIQTYVQSCSRGSPNNSSGQGLQQLLVHSSLLAAVTLLVLVFAPALSRANGDSGCRALGHQRPTRPAWPTSGLLPDRGRITLTAEGVAYVSSGPELVAALKTPTVGVVRLSARVVTVTMADWNTSTGGQLPLHLDHDVAIEGEATDPASWPQLTLDRNHGVVKMRGGVRMSFRHVFMYSTGMLGNPSRMPGLDLFTATEEAGSSSEVWIREAAVYVPYCFPGAAHEQDTLFSAPRPDQYPGPQQPMIILDQAGCSNRTDTPPLQRCWANHLLTADWATYGTDVDPSTGRPRATNILLRLLNSSLLCGYRVDVACLAIKDPFTCLLELAKSTAAAEAETGSSDGGSGWGNSGGSGEGGGSGSSLAPATTNGDSGSATGGVGKAPLQVETEGDAGSRSNRATVPLAAGLGTLGAVLLLGLALAATVVLWRRRWRRPEAWQCNDQQATASDPADDLNKDMQASGAEAAAWPGKGCFPSNSSTTNNDGGGANHRAPAASEAAAAAGVTAAEAGQRRMALSCTLSGDPTAANRYCGDATAAAADETTLHVVAGEVQLPTTAAAGSPQRQQPHGPSTTATPSAAVQHSVTGPAPPNTAAEPSKTRLSLEQILVTFMQGGAAMEGKPGPGAAAPVPTVSLSLQPLSVDTLPPVTPRTPKLPGIILNVRVMNRPRQPPQPPQRELLVPPPQHPQPTAAARESTDKQPEQGQQGQHGSNSRSPRDTKVVEEEEEEDDCFISANDGSYDMMQHEQGPTDSSSMSASASTSAADSSSGGGSTMVELLPTVLGKGSFGRVVQGMYGGRRVAVKLVFSDGPWGMGGGPTSSFVKAFIQEVEVLSRCRHPNVVTLLAACVSPPRLVLVMELMDTSLAAIIHHHNNRHQGNHHQKLQHSQHQQQNQPEIAAAEEQLHLIPLQKVLHIGICITRALAYLHPTITHRDLKPANVLINNPDSNRPTVKLADFGLSRLRITVRSTEHPDAGTPPYMAPECFDLMNKRITHQADMYSLGVILWEMLTAHRPWADIGAVAIAFLVSYQGQRLSLESLDPSRCPPKLARLLVACWDEDPDRRPRAAEAAKELTLLLQQVERQALGASGAGGGSGSGNSAATAAKTT